MLAEGDVVRFYLKDQAFATTTKAYPKGPLDIIFEDGDMVIVNKPAGLLSQPDTPDADSVAGRLYNIYGESCGFAPVVVNRLDKNTTGIVICSKTLPTAQTLSKWIHDQQIDKLYLAIAHGQIDKPITLSGVIVKDGQSNKSTVHESHADGKVIKTTISPVGYNKVSNTTRLQVQLHTGKSHQIRAHLQSIGHPLVGDIKYGGQRLDGVRRQLLHAWRVKLPDGREFTAPPPVDFDRFL